MLRPALSLGYSASNRDAIVFSEASAGPRPIPGLSRPTGNTPRNRRSLKNSFFNPARTCGYMLVGIQICSAPANVNVPLNPFGATPTTVYGTAFRVRLLPTTLASDPSLLTQKL